MALINCSKCGEEIRSAFCYRCGIPVVPSISSPETLVKQTPPDDVDVVQTEFKSKSVSVSGFTKVGREKELARIRAKFEGRGWTFVNYQDEFLGGKVSFQMPLGEFGRLEIRNWLIGMAVVGGLGLVFYLMSLPTAPSSSSTPSQPSVPTNPSEYIKDVVAYKEGPDGVVVYFVLADQNGTPTSASGSVTLTIKYHDDDCPSEFYKVGYTVTVPVRAVDFRTTTVGIGALERKTLLFSFGRIPYSAFTDDIKFCRKAKVYIDLQMGGNTKPLAANTDDITFW